MTVEELLECLPFCDPTMLQTTWLPAMVAAQKKIKLLLQDSVELKLDTHHELRNISEVLFMLRECIIGRLTNSLQAMKSFADDTKILSSTYMKAIASAECLSERNNEDLRDQIEVVEASLEGKDDIITQREQTINQLRHTLIDVVRVLGGFIQTNMSYAMHTSDIELMRQVMQVIADFSRHGRANGLHYVRIPENNYNASLVALREAQAKIVRYKDVATDQNATIKAQAIQLDEVLAKYEKTVELLRQREHELLLLAKENEDLRANIQTLEEDDSVAQSALLLRDGQELQHVRDLEERDMEIDMLRQELGSARQEIVARRADVKNVITQTQQLLAPALDELAEASNIGPVAKARKLFSSDKQKKKPLPSSMSMLDLMGLRGAQHDSVSSDHDRAFLSREIANSSEISSVSSLPQNSSDDILSSPQERVRRASDTYPEHASRPLGGYVGRVVRPSMVDDAELDSPLVNIHKNLPVPPSSILLPEKNGLDTSFSQSSSSSQALKEYSDRLSPGKRILSLIPEVSAEDLQSKKSNYSPTNSEREMYRRSISALDILNSAAIRNAHEYTPEKNRTAGTGTARLVQTDGAARSSKGANCGSMTIRDSPPQTVAQLYHAGQRSRRDRED